MKPVEEEVRGWILGDGAVAAIVATRVFDEVAPQSEELPYVTVGLVGDPAVHGLAGPVGLHAALVQVTGWAKDPRTRRKLGDALRALFESRACGDGTIQRVAIEDYAHSSEFEGSGSEEAYRSVRLDVSITYRRAPAPIGG